MIRRFFAALAAAACVCAAGIGAHGAEGDALQEQVWCLCHPDSCVNLRMRPVNGAVFGAAVCGTEMWTDNRIRKGYLHITEVIAEETTGWISMRYVVYDQPVEVNEQLRIRSDGRVACRRWIGGRITGWVMDGDTVTVYWASAEWAVTDRGYIRTEFIEMPERDGDENDGDQGKGK